MKEDHKNARLAFTNAECNVCFHSLSFLLLQVEKGWNRNTTTQLKDTRLQGRFLAELAWKFDSYKEGTLGFKQKKGTWLLNWLFIYKGYNSST